MNKSYAISRISKDGSVFLDKEGRSFEPFKDGGGFFILNDGSVDPQINRAVNNIYVKNYDAAAYRLRVAQLTNGPLRLWMTADGGISRTLITAKELKVMEV